MIADVNKILIVDDDERDILLTVKVLKDKNLANEIITANDGEEALDYLNRRGKYSEYSNGNPAVILLDIKMPGMNGIDTLREIRSDDNLKYIPVIMLTSSNQEKDLVDSYHLGANAYVIKPVDVNQFIEAIQYLGQFWGVINKYPPDSIHKK